MSDIGFFFLSLNIHIFNVKGFFTFLTFLKTVTQNDIILAIKFEQYKRFFTLLTFFKHCNAKQYNFRH